MDKKLIEEINRAFASKNAKKLKKLNDQLLNSIIEEFEKPHVDLAVLTYALSKILRKGRFTGKKYKEELQKIGDILNTMSKTGQVSSGVTNIQKAFQELESQDPRYIFDLMTKGKIKTAAILYAKGLSLARVAGMLNIPKEEILSYAGKTMMFDRVKEEIPVKKRMEVVEKVFGG